ncbi:MAG: hypothetical protein IKY79_03460 [Bacteroidales bacterium]|nr:hypothetical protein [Bacteroidales bacterium]
MSFEDSMLEDGFHDEEEYLEYLMDEADKEWERQRYEQSSWKEEYYEDEEYYDEEDEEYYNELQERYRQWIKDNPLKVQIFWAWLYFDYEWEYRCNEKNIVLDKFEQWQKDEEYCIKELKAYYHDYYPRILKFFEWKVENPIEEILRQPNIEYFQPIEEFPYAQEIPKRDLLVDEMEDYEEWIKNKECYEQWVLSVSDEDKKEFWDMVNEYDFQNDTSIEHIRECIFEQMKDEINSKKEKVMSWFDEDPMRGQKLFYYIKCVQNYFDS